MPSPTAANPLTRRTLLGMGLAGCSAMAFATGAAEAIPTVDSLTLQILVDNSTFGPFLPDIDRPGLKLARYGGAGPAGPVMSRHALQAEFGLSLLAISRRENRTTKVLVDFGYSPETVRNNLALLGVDLSDLDAAVLSHGHLDHYGGFAGFFGDHAQRRVPLFVGGEETFCERIALIGSPPPVMGALDRAELARSGFAVRIAPTPQVIGGQAFTTGTIPLTSFERAAIPTQMRPGKGCDRQALDPAKRASEQLPDDGEHELATCYAIKGLGLVVIASCSHRGVINSVRQAQKVSGISKVHAVVGGFHLVRPRTEDEARRTVAELQAIDPAFIVPMHCTGDAFIQEALRLMPDKVIRTYVGNRLTFAA